MEASKSDSGIGQKDGRHGGGGAALKVSLEASSQWILSLILEKPMFASQFPVFIRVYRFPCIPIKKNHRLFLKLSKNFY